MAEIIDAGKPNLSGDSVTNWNIIHEDKFRSSYSHIPKERWNEIFGPKREAHQVVTADGVKTVYTSASSVKVLDEAMVKYAKALKRLADK